MATISFDTFVAECAPQLPGCPDPVIIRAVRHAAIQLCRRSLVWVATDEFDTEPGEAYYTLALPAGSEMVVPLSVYIDGTPLPPIGIGVNAKPVELAGESTPSGYTVSGDKELVLNPTPSVTTSVVARYAVCPALTANFIDKWVGTEFYTQIASGAIASLAASSGQPYSNPVIAAHHKQLFGNGVIAAAHKAEKGGTNRALSVFPHPLA